MARTQLSCYVCGGPIKKADHSHGEITLVDYENPPGIVRAWHNRCASGYPDRRHLEHVNDLHWAIVELASHVHGCEELLSPKTRRLVSEVRAASLARVSEPYDPAGAGYGLSDPKHPDAPRMT